MSGPKIAVRNKVAERNKFLGTLLTIKKTKQKIYYIPLPYSTLCEPLRVLNLYSIILAKEGVEGQV